MSLQHTQFPEGHAETPQLGVPSLHAPCCSGTQSPAYHAGSGQAATPATQSNKPPSPHSHPHQPRRKQIITCALGQRTCKLLRRNGARHRGRQRVMCGRRSSRSAAPSTTDEPCWSPRTTATCCNKVCAREQRGRIVMPSTFAGACIGRSAGFSSLSPSHAPQKTLHHSMISSARARSEGGIARPSAFAVLEFITSSNLVVCWTGRSAGLSPLRMRAA